MPASQALKIAEDAIRGKVDRKPGSPIEISCSQGAYTVTFQHETPPEMLGADYDAKVVINGLTGEVIQLKVGP